MSDTMYFITQTESSLWGILFIEIAVLYTFLGPQMCQISLVSLHFVSLSLGLPKDSDFIFVYITILV